MLKLLEEQQQNSGANEPAPTCNSTLCHEVVYRVSRPFGFSSFLVVVSFRQQVFCHVEV